MRSSLAFLIVVTLWGAPGLAQGIPFPGSDGYDFSAQDVTVGMGESFSLPILIETTAPVTNLGLYATNDPGRCAPTTFQPGAGVLAYEAEHGSIPCDVGISPDHVFVAMGFYGMPYESDVYGAELFILTYQVTATQPGTTTIELLNAYTMLPEATVTVTIVDAPTEFVRGDLDGDGTCSIADAVNVLQLAFVPGHTTDCWDSADVDDSGAVDLTDAVRLLQMLFVEPGAMPESCGLDGSADSLPDCQRDNCS